MLASILKISLLVFVISVLWTKERGAPWAPTPMEMVHKMLKMAKVGPGDVVYDLGCGDGRMIIAATRRYGAHAVGIELDPLRFIWCQILITFLGLRGRVRIIFGDFYKQDLSAADVVTCYLLQSTNNKLQAKFKQELRPDTRVVTNFFTFPKLHLVSADKEDKLYLYTLQP
jgi:SAM-dependent methyltransferase